MKKPNVIQLVLSLRTELAEGICEFQFAAQDGSVLPEFTPGSHIAVMTPGGMNRQYSLINDGTAPTFYQIAVKLEPDSRGGSRSLHDELLVGSSVSVQSPENSFELVDSTNYLLIGGGIGITPIMAMASACKTRNIDFTLVYCARSADAAAYADLIASQFPEEAHIHFDEGDPAQLYDFWDHFMVPTSAHVYCCGPKPLMEEVKALSGHWPAEQIHFEDFNPQAGNERVNHEFTVRLTATGAEYPVGADQTILSTLRSHDIEVPSSCESGTCGSCRMKLVSGEVEHRDFVLESGEYDKAIMICVSRGKESIEIDFEDY